MTPVHAELIARARQTVCVCGAIKDSWMGVFCERCWERLWKVDGRLAMRAVRIQSEHKPENFWAYDLACDALLDPNFGTKRKPQQED